MQQHAVFQQVLVYFLLVLLCIIRHQDKQIKIYIHIFHSKWFLFVVICTVSGSRWSHPRKEKKTNETCLFSPRSWMQCFRWSLLSARLLFLFCPSCRLSTTQNWPNPPLYDSFPYRTTTPKQNQTHSETTTNTNKPIDSLIEQKHTHTQTFSLPNPR